MGDGSFLVVTADDGTIPLRPGQTVESVLATRRELELHQYYEEIRAHTFETVWVDVSVEAAEGWRRWNRGASGPSDAAAEAFAALNREVDAAVREVAGRSASGRAFVRMSTRSPKDAFDKVPRLRDRAVAELRSRFSSTGGADPPSPNAQLAALDDTVGGLLSVRDGHEAWELFALSERCVSDLVRLLDYRHALPCWDLKIIIREYVPLPSSSEYRCFVHEGTLTAISQYFASTFYPEVVATFSATQERIQRFFADHCTTITLGAEKSFILDVAVTAERVWIIELNPFSPTTGSCLFNWDADAETLRSSPVEFRVRREPLRGVEALVRPYRPLMEQALCKPNADTPTHDSRCDVM